jgi:hypothetical protein
LSVTLKTKAHEKGQRAMMGRFYRWLRVVLPPVPWSSAMVLAWVGLHGIIIAFLATAMIEFHESDLGWPGLDEIALTIGREHAAALSALAFLYGISRVIAFHPAASEKYRQWLALTPWTSQRPLPLGPIHPVWQDAVLVGLWIVLPTLYAWPDTCYGPIGFFIGYAAILTILNWRTSRDLHVYATCALAGMIILLLPLPAAALSVSAATAVLALSGARRSLSEFPWEASFARRQIPEVWVYQKNRTAPTSMSPDLAARRLSPYPKLGPSIRVTQAALISLILGWLAFAVAYHTRNEEDFDRVMRMAVLALACMFALFRTSHYVELHWWPISLIGRIGTRRWFLPGYDQVFLAPLATVGAGFLLPGLFGWFGLPALVAGPFTIALTMFIILSAPPTMESWHYSCSCRLSDKIPIRYGNPNSLRSSQFEKQ